ncbi:MAG TPA: amidase family protein [Tepidiformaceae bacterium]|nr:amidase family protein [Tepidiformaceae bacterium]
MYRMPDAKQISAVAKAIGASVGEAEAEQYRPYLIDVLRMVDQFMQSRTMECPPPKLYPERAPGYRPRIDEDTYRAWLWKCDIGGADTGLLAGKTVSFKDHISVAGIPQVFTSVALEGFIPDVDATVVTRVLGAGAKVIGKHMMNGFVGDFGMPLNPHNPAHTPGGSSSGSGAALAAGEVDISFGGDQGGSVRLPAAHCGIVGMKPTFGLISHFGAGFGSEMTVDHVGPMARKVEDVAAALQVVGGYDPLDPRQRREVPESIDVLSGLDGGVKGLRIGVLKEGFMGPIQPEVAEAVMKAIRVLEQAGAEVCEISVPEHAQMDGVYQTLTLEGSKAMFDAGFFGVGYNGYYPQSTVSAVGRLWHEQTDQLPARTKLNLIAAEFVKQSYNGGAYAKAQNAKAGFVAAFDNALSKVDVLAMPTSLTVAPEVAPLSTDPKQFIEDNLGKNWIVTPMAYNTKPTNYTGHPALAVPCGKVGGLPTSIQLVGRKFEDGLLLRAAYAFQQSVDWDEYTRVK